VTVVSLSPYGGDDMMVSVEAGPMMSFRIDERWISTLGSLDEPSGSLDSTRFQWSPALFAFAKPIVRNIEIAWGFRVASTSAEYACSFTVEVREFETRRIVSARQIHRKRR